ncbi:MAG TPA: PEP-CTERM sorting domain-containing protein [Gemmataceae bacterium]|jgi:hypothetical protein|nr:PEP-CTERM sorting domain-containing protein [Gemmataceae bacterium]
MALRWFKVALAAALFGAGGSAQAGLLPLSSTAVPDGDSAFRYTYGVMLTSNSTLQTGDMFVIYDFAGYLDGSNEQPEGFEFAAMNTGGNPGRTVPNDNPELPNLVWTYTGETPLIGQIGLGNFSALSTKPESSIDTDFVSRTHVEDPNGEVREEDNITHTKAPTGTNDPPPVDPPVDPPPAGVPEPSSLLLLGAGVPFLVARFRKGKKAAEVVA